MITTKKLKDTVYEVIFENGVKLGEILMEVDGFYVFYPLQNGGYWDEMGMSSIATILHDMNKGWQEEINKLLK